MKHTVLSLDRGHPGQLQALEDEGYEVLRPGRTDPEKFIRDHSEDIQAIATVLTPVRKPLIEALPNLGIISVGAVGVDHIDVDAAVSRDVSVTHTPDVLTADTADMAVLLLMNVARRAVEGDAFVRAGMWQSGPLPLGTTLAGKKAGIVGLGRIGQAIAKRLAAFEMDIAYFGPREKPDMPYPYYGDLDSLASAVDFLVLACPGGKHTKHLVNYTILKALGPSGFLINIARGSVVHEKDLLMALANRTIAGAGLDVFADEPHVPDDLISMDNVVLTPHIGSATRETRTEMGALVADNIKAYFAGRPLLTPCTSG